jgi:hypothetical protein
MIKIAIKIISDKKIQNQRKSRALVPPHLLQQNCKLEAEDGPFFFENIKRT